eukprot:CAMPEP_0201876562 /NCGR_PEP_ID=MMETSP0902-20130614/8222_1 /ASSEMBLY_ACC=CAM_ASM_000551 /TAXON_ID=420261 /ORGANISM="Thalassiosira antarctica, Strain CCMP982" /LENGTH=77 /DNA_ID=CAMNT_0048403837 /DNA_START=16 /DNA_END=245 /DNA_ORIENTATION=+
MTTFARVSIRDKTPICLKFGTLRPFDSSINSGLRDLNSKLNLDEPSPVIAATINNMPQLTAGGRSEALMATPTRLDV